MTKRYIPIFLLFILLQLSYTSNTVAQNVGLAKDLYTHNLKSRALEIFIEILHNSKSSTASKAEALYFMGQISFDDGRCATAFDDWQVLIKDYPTNLKVIEIKDRPYQLKDVFTRVSDASITSTIAQSYIKNGDFWSKADEKFTIDASWLHELELAFQ